MKNLILISALIACGSSMASAVNSPIPYRTEAVENYQSGTKIKDQSARVKISVALNGLTEDSAVLLGGLVLCSDKACFKPDVSGYHKIYDTSKGTAELLADVVIPALRIESVYFEEAIGSKVFSGSVKLPAAIKFDDEFNKGEILIFLSRDAKSNKLLYYPSSSAVGYFNDEGQSVYYDPVVGLDANLKGDATLSIPKKSTATPYIFIVSVNDTGDSFPQVDIYPYITLKNPATIEVDRSEPSSQTLRINKAFTPTPSTTAYVDPRSGNIIDNSISQRTVAPTRSKTTFSKTKVLKPSDLEKADGSEVLDLDVQNKIGGAATAAAAATCAEIMANPANMQIINNFLSQNGVVNVEVLAKRILLDDLSAGIGRMKRCGHPFLA